MNHFLDCQDCGRRFIAKRFNALRCPQCRDSKKRQRDNARSHTTTPYIFTGIDGEGVDRPDGTHEYVLLSIGDESLCNPDGSRLTTQQIFHFVCDYGEAHPREILVGYYLTYDYANWFKDLPESRAFALLSNEGIASRRRKVVDNLPPYPVECWGIFEIDILGTKRFKIRRRKSLKSPWGKWIYVCDGAAFFQSSFLTAIDPRGWSVPIVTDDEFAIIKKGKEDRSAQLLPYDKPVTAEMRRYNIAENAAQRKLMNTLRDGFEESGLFLKRNSWFGPGQAADAWMAQIIPEHRGEIINSEIDPELLDAASATYYGGWFEIPCHGHIPGITYEYDINSAYPASIASLPCLRHGYWTDSPEDIWDPECYTMVYGEFRGKSEYLGPVQHRLAGRTFFGQLKGTIMRPLRSRGWHWASELTASERAGLLTSYEVEQVWQYKPCSCKPPMMDIQRLYQGRLDAGKNTPRGKALKLVYNSSYGKLAQSVGNPKWTNAIWASLITSGCRTQILDAIATHPNGASDVVMIATDGIYFRTPHPYLDIDPKRLGAWDAGTKENLTLFKPGVYWDDKVREKIAKGERSGFGAKSRGINEAALADGIQEADRLFTLMLDNVGEYNRKYADWPTLRVYTPFTFITPKAAVHRGKWHICGEVQSKHSTERADPFTKRNVRKLRIVDGILRTSPYHWTKTGYEVETMPYDKALGRANIERSDNGNFPTVDGDLSQGFMEYLNLRKFGTDGLPEEEPLF